MRLRSAATLMVIPPTRFAHHRIFLGDTVTCNDQPVDVIVHRGPSNSRPADGFAENDAHFAGAESHATLLGITTHPTVLAINPGDPETWYAPSPWPAWRARCLRAGVPVAPVTVGGGATALNGLWLTWGGITLAAPSREARALFGSAVFRPGTVEEVVVCCDHVIAGDPSAAPEARRLLERNKIRLARILLDDKGRVVSLDPVPGLSEEIAERAASLLGELIAS